MLGHRNDLGARSGEERIDLVEVGAVEHPGGFGDAFDLVEESVALDAIGRILQSVLGEHDQEPRRDPGALAAQDATHPLNHLPPGAAHAHDDSEVGVGDVDALVEHARRGDRVEPPNPQVVEYLVVAGSAVEPVMRSIDTRGSRRLIARPGSRSASRSADPTSARSRALRSPSRGPAGAR